MKKLLLILLLIPFFNFSQVQIGQDIDGEAEGDGCGGSVSISSDGSIVAIGASGNDGNGNNSGHVRVYENQSGVWTQVGTDIDGETVGDLSGESVSLSSDGSILAIGARFNDGISGPFSGHVRVYENQSGVWTQVGTDIDGETFSDNSGYSISLSSDGSIIAIGAYNNDGVNLTGCGHVRVYRYLSDTWTQIGNDIDGEVSFDRSGISVSLSSDGSIVAIGAYNGDSSNIRSSGYVKVYRNISDTWIQIGSNIDGESINDRSGASVSLSSDGSIVAIGAKNNNGVNGTRSGHVRVYRNVADTWMQIGNDIDGELEYDESGYSVSLFSDGSIVAIGGPGNDSSSGHVRVYRNISDIWTQIGTDIDGEASSDLSGYSVSLSSDASILSIGARNNDGNGNNSGHVRVYDLSALLSKKDQTITYFNIYPNPTKNQFTIQLENPLDLKNVTIYNNLGQQILTSKNYVIDTSKIASGLYIVELETTQGKGTKKLIID